MGVCRDCRFWTVDTPFEDEIEDLRAGIGLGWGSCSLGRSRDGRPVVSETKAFAQDGEDYSGVLVTRPDFGCVQFQSGGPL